MAHRPRAGCGRVWESVGGGVAGGVVTIAWIRMPSVDHRAHASPTRSLSASIAFASTEACILARSSIAPRAGTQATTGGRRPCGTKLTALRPFPAVPPSQSQREHSGEIERAAIFFCATFADVARECAVRETSYCMERSTQPIVTRTFRSVHPLPGSRRRRDTPPKSCTAACRLSMPTSANS